MSAPAPRYTYDPVSARYRGPGGRYVDPTTVHGWLVETTANAGRSLRDLTQQLRSGAIDLRSWQLAMTDNIRLAHIANAAAAKGGLAQLTTADYARIESIVADNLNYLDRFSRGLADGSIPMDGRILARAEQYALSGRQTYADFHRREMLRHGMAEERNERSKADSCEGCLSETARGWVAIGTLSLPGSRTCLARCGCQLVFR